MNVVPVVDIRALTKEYGRHRAVDGVTLQIAEGEVFGLLGPNGSGKSTILKMLIGGLTPTAGTLAIKGFDVRTQGPIARALVGYVPEEPTLYPQMQVSEFLRFMGRLKGLAAVSLRDKLEVVTTLLDLGAVHRTAIGKLSHGFRQRVLIAQALLNDPPLLILDEPTNGLDPYQIIELRELIKRLAPRHTILLTSHILSEIERVATRVGILLAGRLLTDSAAGSAEVRIALQVIPPAGLSLDALFAALPGLIEARELSPCALGVAYEIQLASTSTLQELAQRLAIAQCVVLELRALHSDLEARFLALTARAAQ
jgi:ABC-2 type transport system ATP-binding protein